jgi:antitoxin component HigA of HigAB toxin-antitoxin module
MTNITSINNQEEYHAALSRLDTLMGAELGTPECYELCFLDDLIEQYESKNFFLEELEQTTD